MRERSPPRGHRQHHWPLARAEGLPQWCGEVGDAAQMAIGRPWGGRSMAKELTLWTTKRKEQRGVLSEGNSAKWVGS